MEAKKIKNRTELIIYVLAILGLVAVVNYLGTRWFKRIDMTEGKEYSISKTTKKILKGLDDIITVKVYFSEDLPAHVRRTVTDVNDVLTEYQVYGGKNLKISREDPSTSESAKEMARSLGIPEVQMQTIEKDKAQVVNGYLGIAILFEDKKETIPVVQNLQNLEYDLTMAIMKVSRKTTPKVGIVKIDTVAPIPPQMRMQMQNPPETTEDMFKSLYENLRMNYEVSTVNLTSSVDNSIKTLVVPGLDNIDEQGAYAIDQFFMNGGNLIVLADAVTVDFQYGINARPVESKVLEMLEHYGVRVEKDMILDASCGQVAVPQRFGQFQMNVPVPYPYFVRIGQDGFNAKNPAVSALNGAIIPWAHSLTFLV
ncbi:MAG: GldG family protein, partial [Fibrobacter sp.]|nr:GldG family protein [Fibrobacter sp.]